MKLEPVKAVDKLGREVTLRSAELTDADDLIRYLKITAGETPFLMRDPDEIRLSLEEEQRYVKSCMDDPRALMLLALTGGQHMGTCSLTSLGPYRRYSHRCQVAVALYQKYWGPGLER